MKKIIALTLALVSVTAFALNPNRTWFGYGETFKYVGYSTSTFTDYESKEAAVEGAIAFIEDLSSGEPSRRSMQLLNTAHILWDSGDSCKPTHGWNARLVVKEMAKGHVEVISIGASSKFDGQGVESFRSSVTFYAPCVKKNRD